MLGTVIIFWLGSSQRSETPGQYYSIVFGGYVALSAVDGAVLRG
jgi:hypothetical protein